NSPARALKPSTPIWTINRPRTSLSPRNHIPQRGLKTWGIHLVAEFGTHSAGVRGNATSANLSCPLLHLHNPLIHPSINPLSPIHPSLFTIHIPPPAPPLIPHYTTLFRSNSPARALKPSTPIWTINRLRTSLSPRERAG